MNSAVLAIGAIGLILGVLLGVALTLGVIARFGAEGLCAKNLLCIRTPLHKLPQQVVLTWRKDPASSLTFTWKTQSQANPSRVQFRRVGDEAWQAAGGETLPAPRNGLFPGAGVLHRVTVEGLDPATGYEYRLSCDPGHPQPWGPVHRTSTAVAKGGSFTFAFFADTGLAGRVDGLAGGTCQVMQEIADAAPGFLIGGGDYAYANRDGRFTRPEAAINAWLGQMQPVLTRMPFMTQYGNHETRLKERIGMWAPYFAYPPGDHHHSYSFDVADAHFTAILADGYCDLSSGLLRWLDADLAAARERGAHWLIVFQHEPVFGHGSSHPARDEARATLMPLFTRHGVDLHLSAHDQNYERTFPLRGDPANPEIASTSPDRYRSGDGVVYAKISPAGKRSEIGQDFSRLRDPQPAFVAMRNDTDHHYGLVRVSPEAIVVDVYAVAGDGSPGRRLDGFSITRAS